MVEFLALIADLTLKSDTFKQVIGIMTEAIKQKDTQQLSGELTSPVVISETSSQLEGDKKLSSTGKSSSRKSHEPYPECLMSQFQRQSLERL